MDAEAQGTEREGALSDARQVIRIAWHRWDQSSAASGRRTKEVVDRADAEIEEAIEGMAGIWDRRALGERESEGEEGWGSEVDIG